VLLHSRTNWMVYSNLGAYPFLKQSQLSHSWLYIPQTNGKMGVSGRICLYVACYDFVLGFNVSSLVLMIYWDIVRGGLGS
jgi:hypothetical protein